MQTSQGAPVFDGFSVHDVSDIALQRTDTLTRVPKYGAISFQAWKRGISAPLLAESFFRRKKILSAAWRDAQAEWSMIHDLLPAAGTSICDIGCGHAMIDLAAFRERSDLQISLIDIERTEARHHGFNSTGAGYGSLDSAKAFLVRNGVQPSRIDLCNPTRDPLPEGPFDMIISIISAGFHYPISEYVPFALRTLKSGAPLVFDMRVNTDQMSSLAEFSSVRVLHRTKTCERVAAFK